MAINKVIDRNNNVLIDLTNDTIEANKVLEGVVFHDCEGNVKTGTLPKGNLDSLKTKFIDYTGNILYQLSDEEIDALTEMPAAPDRTSDNLTFEGWNWTLEELKAVDRTSPIRPVIGTVYAPSDGKTYIIVRKEEGKSLTTKLCFHNNYSNNYPTFKINWGDGTEENFSIEGYSSLIYPTHDYSTYGEYTIVIEVIEGDKLVFGNSSWSTSGSSDIIEIRVGNIALGAGVPWFASPAHTIILSSFSVSNYTAGFGEWSSDAETFIFPRAQKFKSSQGTTYLMNLKNLSLPGNLKDLGRIQYFGMEELYIPDSVEFVEGITYCYNLKYLHLPRNFKDKSSSKASSPQSINITNNYVLKYIDFNGNPADIWGYVIFSTCYNLRNCFITSNPSTISSSLFESCYSMEYIEIPDAITKVSASNLFKDTGRMNKKTIIDLSKRTTFLTLTSSIGLSTSYAKILVPMAEVDTYKNASYWSNYASGIIGV